jgi:hypothetical protein
MTTHLNPTPRFAFPHVIRTLSDEDTGLLDQSISNLLCVMREALAMDITFVSRRALDDVVVSHASAGPGEIDIQGTKVAFDESFCQRVLDGRLPAVMPDVAALQATHDVPATPLAMTLGTYMTTPIWLQDGTMYGLLCCLRWSASSDLSDLHSQRLEMSARQIARLIDEAGVR